MTYSEAKTKAAELVALLTPEECVSQLLYTSAPIERLGIKEHNWWNEALHGVARAGTATVFPQSIGLAATFNPELINEIASAIAVEARAKYNKSVEYNDRDIYKGLTYWSPNINIFRDPRWGRGQETFGEDPFLTATIGCEFVKGLQGDGEFLKAAACSKHFAVHSGPEKNRHSFDAIVNKQDLYETYLPAFEWLVKKAGVVGVMGAYNRTNGEPCCASEHLVKEILLDDWGFKGYVVSDCGALDDIYKYHHFTNSHTESAALALKLGCNLNCGETYKHLVDAYEQDLITDEDLKNATTRLYTIRYLLGEFEENRPYSDIEFDKLDCEEHRKLNEKASESTLVLLQNVDNFLPLNKENIKKIAVVGPNSMSTLALEGNYNGRASEYITVAEGIRKVFTDSKITVEEGSQLVREALVDWAGFGNLRSSGVSTAAEADVTVLCLGLDRSIEGEEGCAESYAGLFEGGDKCTLYLPQTQQKLAEEVCDACDNVIVVVMAGSPLDVGDKVREKAKAIIYAWYPGARGGLAVANMIAGEFSPSGRLPMTFPRGDVAIPDFEDYSMENRTYRFMKDKPLYPFGYGLTYTSFEFTNPAVRTAENGYKLSVDVENVGKFESNLPIMVFAKYTDSRVRTPIFQLCAIANDHLEVGEKKNITLDINAYWLKAVDNDGKRIDPDGGITLYVGTRQPDAYSTELCGDKCLEIKL